MDATLLMEKEDGNDWKEYFGIEEETVEDIWEDDELAHSFRDLFVEQISLKDEESKRKPIVL